MQECAVIVNSCDKYEDAWHPFFRLFDIMWSDCPYDVYLNTETKDCTETLHGGPIKTLHPPKTRYSWTKRLKYALQQIDSEYVITFLEDFFLMSPVRQDVIDKSIDLMERNCNIAGIELYITARTDKVYDYGFVEKNPESTCLLNTYTWLWRKDFLLSVLKNENAWDFELYASVRYKYHHKNTTIVTVTDEYLPVFDYCTIPSVGYGISGGKWSSKNKELFEKYGIEVDFTQRETVADVETKAHIEEKHKTLGEYLVRIRDNPRELLHYMKCLKRIIRHQYKTFLARFFNL